MCWGLNCSGKTNYDNIKKFFNDIDAFSLSNFSTWGNCEVWDICLKRRI